MKTYNVESFNLDHTKVQAPFVRLAGVKEGTADTIYKYDIRFIQPNEGLMPMRAVHSLEHLIAENSRNHSEDIVDISPMGCQTGFYWTMLNDGNYERMLDLVEATLRDAMNAEELPAQNPVQCGNANHHDFEGAKKLAADMLAKRDEWHIIFKDEA
ncbi:S-ribosylhomocysteine lyase [Exiguobacterium aestuarii]|uniref:S-ribosylhomocysteine lyase n=1 Tax=Exiguobacterium aestuarii TaxID=273527 RepID=A0ABW2PK48_9BACL|nr:MULTISPECIES: S-ribosylhomocysteine lyase [Exiguobacterium]MCT4786802.1 S-ribosylhomocysteine lyase [Exiguobacterium aestuarii]